MRSICKLRRKRSVVNMDPAMLPTIEGMGAIGFKPRHLTNWLLTKWRGWIETNLSNIGKNLYLTSTKAVSEVPWGEVKTDVHRENTDVRWVGFHPLKWRSISKPWCPSSSRLSATGCSGPWTAKRSAASSWGTPSRCQRRKTFCLRRRRPIS